MYIYIYVGINSLHVTHCHTMQAIDVHEWPIPIIRGQAPLRDICDWHEILSVVAASEQVGPETLQRRPEMSMV